MKGYNIKVVESQDTYKVLKITKGELEGWFFVVDAGELPGAVVGTELIYLAQEGNRAIRTVKLMKENL